MPEKFQPLLDGTEYLVIVTDGSNPGWDVIHFSQEQQRWVNRLEEFGGSSEVDGIYRLDYSADEKHFKMVPLCNSLPAISKPLVRI